MLDKSIDGALLALRKGIIRGDGAGLAHVEALLALRGVALPRVLPAKRADAAKRSAMKRLVMEALRSGPATGPAVAAYVAAHRPELAPCVAHKRTVQTLSRLKGDGLVAVEVRMGRWVWELPKLNGATGALRTGANHLVERERGQRGVACSQEASFAPAC